MTRTSIKLLGAALLTGMLLTVPVREAMAAGSVTVTSDKEAIGSGETFVVNFKAEGDGDGAEQPEISVEYDENRLVLTECDKEYGGGGGKLTFTETEANITFAALSGGVADVYVTAVLDGDGAEPATGSVSVTVDGEDTAAAMGAGADTSSSTGVEAGTVPSLDGTKTISTVFPDEMMPELFHKTTASYSGTTIEAAQFDMGNLLLVYVTDEATNTGNFCIIDPATGALTDFRMIRGIENRFIIVTSVPSDVEIPLNFTKATLKWNDQNLEAYTIVTDGGDGSSEAQTSYENDGVSAKEFFLVYAVSSEGNEGWYLYDQAEGTYQRYLQVIRTAVDDEGNKMPITEAAEEAAAEKYEKPMFIRLIIICALGALSLILLIIVIVLAVKRDDDDYDDDDEDDDDDDYAGRRSAAAGRGRKSRVQVDEDDDEDDEDDDEDDDDEDDEDDDEDDDDEDDDDEDDDDDYEDDDDEDDDDEDDDDEDDDVKVAPAPRSAAPVKAQAKAAAPVEKAVPSDNRQPVINTEDVMNPRREKKRRKQDDFASPQAIDWSEMQTVMREAASDSRRPTGNNTSSLPPRYRMDAAPAKAAGEAVKSAAEAVEAPVKTAAAAAGTAKAAKAAGAAAAGAAVKVAETAGKSAYDTVVSSEESGRARVAPATPIVAANMPKKAGFTEEEQAAPPTPEKQVKAEKKGLFGKKGGLFDYDEDDEDEDDIDEDEGFSFFRRDKKKVPKKVESRKEAARRQEDDYREDGYDRGYGDQGYDNRQQPYSQQGYDQGYNRGYVNAGYDQGYQGQGYQGQPYQGQGYQGQGYDRNYGYQQYPYQNQYPGQNQYQYQNQYPGQNQYQYQNQYQNQYPGDYQYRYTQEDLQNAGYNTTDLDEDFEFEFLGIDE